MKRILSLALVALMLLASFVGCGKVETLKMGMGVYAYYEAASSADGDTDGVGEVVATVAAVLLDKDGKIVKCEIDAADNVVNFTSAGAAVPAGEFATKYELGTNYNMAAYGDDRNGDGVVKEWFEQADAFEAVCVGKTVDEVKALLADGYYGTEEVAKAGCTIGVLDFVKAVEKAVANAADTAATAEDTLKVAVFTAATGTDATADAAGKYEMDISFAAAATKAGTVNAMVTDTLSVVFDFDAKGVTATDVAAALQTKGELGTAYNMAAYGTDLNGDGVVKEWNEQASIFSAACIGLNADGIAALVSGDYYHGVETLQIAGCTMGVSDLAMVAVKAAK